MVEELAGMPDPLNLVTKKVTGVIAETYLENVPEIGDEMTVHELARVKSILEKKNKDGDIEFVVTYEIV